jgi:chemotaxis protein CheX
MIESDLYFFVDSLVNYFKQVTGVEAQTGVPYVKTQEPVVLELTGIIGISGKRKGSIYFTAKRDLLENLEEKILGKSSGNPNALKDLAGEIANTIAGNVREAYGSSFLISVPVVVEGFPKDIKYPDDVPTFVIPISWESHNGYLVVCME